MEDIVTDYISLIGHQNFPKNIGQNENGDTLNTDQLFTIANSNTLVLIEQKIRDDHDSTKKRGQFSNFIFKVELLKHQYPQYDLVGVMWFIDDGLLKNKNYYKSEMQSYMNTHSDVSLKMCYGGELFDELLEKADVWEEIIEYLRKNKQDRNQEMLRIPDFDTSEEILNALKKLPTKYKRKLLSSDEKYVQLRAELFSTNFNLSKI